MSKDNMVYLGNYLKYIKVYVLKKIHHRLVLSIKIMKKKKKRKCI